MNNQSEPNTTREDVVRFLRKHVMPFLVDDVMAVPLSAFGGMTADAFAGRTSWHSVLGVYKRMYE